MPRGFSLANSRGRRFRPKQRRKLFSPRRIHARPFDLSGLSSGLSSFRRLYSCTRAKRRRPDLGALQQLLENSCRRACHGGTGFVGWLAQTSDRAAILTRRHSGLYGWVTNFELFWVCDMTKTLVLLALGVIVGLKLDHVAHPDL